MMQVSLIFTHRRALLTTIIIIRAVADTTTIITATIALSSCQWL